MADTRPDPATDRHGDRDDATLRTIGSGDRTLPLDRAAAQQLEADGLARAIASHWELTRKGRERFDSLR